MSNRDYYNILGVPRDADKETIQKAWRKLARQYHPDVNPGDKKAEERFKEVAEAYEVLRDDEKRARYDQFGANWQQGQGQHPNAGGMHYQTYQGDLGDLNDLFGSSGGFQDLFESVLGGRGRQAGPRRGGDAEAVAQITLEEAYQGTQRRLRGEDDREITVTIPRGVSTGSRVRFAGKGQPGREGGTPGDLYVMIEVLPDPRFAREDDDLFTDVDVSLYTALLGGRIDVPTLAGHVGLAIPPETQNGRLFRLTGRGMPKLKTPSEYGDLYARIRVKLPTKLSEEERGLFAQLRDLR